MPLYNYKGRHNGGKKNFRSNISWQLSFTHLADVALWSDYALSDENFQSRLQSHTRTYVITYLVSLYSCVCVSRTQITFYECVCVSSHTNR